MLPLHLSLAAFYFLIVPKSRSSAMLMMSFWRNFFCCLCYKQKRSAVANTNLVENSVTQALSLWNKSRCWVKQPHKEEQKQLGFQSHILPELWWNSTLYEMVSTQYTQFASKLQIGLKTENLNHFTGVKPSRHTGALWTTISLTGLNSLLVFLLGSKNCQKWLAPLLAFRAELMGWYW